MAGLIKSKKLESEQLYVAIDSFVSSALPEYGPFPVAAHARFRGDHPIVRVCSDFFVPDGTPLDEIAAARTKLYMASQPPVEPPRPVVPEERRIEDEDALVNVFNGSRVRKGDPEAKRRPDWYVPVVPRGLSRRDALVATSELRQIGDGGKPERVVRANTWVSRDDPLVELHPYSFRMPDTAEPIRTPATASTRTAA